LAHSGIPPNFRFDSWGIGFPVCSGVSGADYIERFTTRRGREVGGRFVRRIGCLLALPISISQPFHGLRNELGTDVFALFLGILPQSGEDNFGRGTAFESSKKELPSGFFGV
jgi:hypothetical protein